MTPLPDRLWHISWREFRLIGDRDEQRRYRNPARAARQVLAILSAPDDVVELRELAVTDGWDADSLSWCKLDPREFVVAHLTEERDEDDESSLLDRYAAIEAVWREHLERVGGRAGTSPTPGVADGSAPRIPSPAPPVTRTH